MNEWDAEQRRDLSARQPAIGGRSGGKRLVGGQCDERVQSRIQTIDTRQKMPCQLDARNPPGSQLLGEFADG
jgi:hypothetical protein